MPWTTRTLSLDECNRGQRGTGTITLSWAPCVTQLSSNVPLLIGVPPKMICDVPAGIVV